MAGKPKKQVQDETAMLESARAKRGSSALYRGRSDTMEANDAKISEIVTIAAAQMANTMDGGRIISLTDTQAVQAVILQYMQACSNAAICPSVTGLAAATGHTRAALYSFLKTRPEHPTSLLLRNCQEMFAEILAQASLSGAVAAIPSIFVLKARLGWRDDAVDELPEPPKDTINAKEIMERYGDLPD